MPPPVPEQTPSSATLTPGPSRLAAFVALTASALAASPTSQNDQRPEFLQQGQLVLPQVPEGDQNPFAEVQLPPLAVSMGQVAPAPAAVQSSSDPKPIPQETPQLRLDSIVQSEQAQQERTISSRVVSEIQSFIDIATEKPVGAFIAVMLAIGGIRGCIKAFGILHKWYSSWNGLRNNVLINAPTLQLHWLEKREDGSVSLKMRAIDVNHTPNNIYSNGTVAWVWNKALKKCTSDYPLPSLIYHNLANRLTLRTTGLHDADSHLQTFNKGLRNAYSSNYKDGHKNKRLGVKTLDWVDYVIPLCEVGPTGSRDVTYAVISHNDWFELGRERFDESPDKVSPHQRERMRQLRKALHEYKKSLRALGMDPEDPNLGNPEFQGNPNKHIFPRVICSQGLTAKQFRQLQEANGKGHRPDRLTVPQEATPQEEAEVVVPPPTPA